MKYITLMSENPEMNAADRDRLHKLLQAQGYEKTVFPIRDYEYNLDGRKFNKLVIKCKFADVKKTMELFHMFGYLWIFVDLIQ